MFSGQTMKFKIVIFFLIFIGGLFFTKSKVSAGCPNCGFYQCDCNGCGTAYCFCSDIGMGTTCSSSNPACSCGPGGGGGGGGGGCPTAGNSGGWCPPPPCSPSCSPACGQSDGCGGTCSTNAMGNPGNIATLTPANGGSAAIDPVTGKVTISWSKAGGADTYDLELLPAADDGTTPSFPVTKGDPLVCWDPNGYFSGYPTIIPSGNLLPDANSTDSGGLNASYYDNANWTGTTVSQTDSTVNFSWGVGAPTAGIGSTLYSVAWGSGSKLMTDATGPYTFYSFADDGVQFSLDGSLKINSLGDKNRTWLKGGPYSLTAGTTHDVLYKYQHVSGGQSQVGLYWGFPSNCTYYNKALAADWPTQFSGIKTLTYSFVPHASAYTFRVRPINISCNANGEYGSWSASSTFKIGAKVTGYTVTDTGGTAYLSGNSCTMTNWANFKKAPTAAASVLPEQSGSTYSPVGVTQSGVNKGQYTATVDWNKSTSVTLDTGDPNLVCSCPVGCTYGGIFPPTGNPYNFFISLTGGNWFQIQGGDVSASTQSNAFIDPISSQCTSPTCSPYPLLPITGGTTAQQGALLTLSSGLNVDVSDVSGYQSTPVGPAGSSYSVKTTSSLACKENYDYFYRLYSLGLEGTTQAPQDDFIAPANNPDHAQKPSVAALSSSGAYYHRGDMTIDNNWTLAGSESYVIFVNGNLNITNDAHITMPVGTFLSFIVSGDINIDPSVGQTDPTSITPVLQGVFIANGNIIVQTLGSDADTDEKKFVGAGTFAACGSIQLLRDYRNSLNQTTGVYNNKYPASLIQYRPDVITSTPDKMKRPILNWREVAP